MKRLYFLLLGLASLYLAAPVTAQAQQERILSFNSRILIQSNADLVVTETIQVWAGGERIKRGIYRDFPQLYRSRWGLNQRTKFDVLSVKRDGRPEPYHTERKSNGQRVYIGNASTFLNPGNYTYELIYRTDRQLGFFEKHDELYWNVTGNGWEFPIVYASATVVLPGDTPVQGVEAYTGAQGSKGAFYRANIPFINTAFFETTGGLSPKEGLTVVVSWPKGYVTPIGQRALWARIIQDNWSLVLALVGLVLVFWYYFLVWAAVGKDPKRGVIIPRYQPPKGFSPGAARYLLKIGYDNKVFAANVLSLAVKKALTIKKEGSTYSLIRKSAAVSGLTPDETVVFATLLEGRQQIELKQTSHVTIAAAVASLKKSLASFLEKTYFIKNSRYWVPGLLFSLIPCVVSLLGTNEWHDVAGISIWLAIWTMGTTFLLSNAYSLWRGRQWGQAVVATLFALPFLGGECLGLVLFTKVAALWVPVVFAMGALMNGIFYHLLKAPTVMGRKVLDELEGFRLYLSVAEKDRLNLENPPQRTPELFEMFLPYALALDVEQAWSEQFKDVLVAAGQGDREYHPGWYTGVGLGALASGAFASSLGSSLSSAISSSSTVPGSSSGGGGGGSSGGGGGGGGGGGW